MISSDTTWRSSIEHCLVFGSESRCRSCLHYTGQPMQSTRTIRGCCSLSHHLGHPRMLPSRTYPSPRTARRGFQAWSVARNIANQWDSIVHGADVVILDWQLARHLVPLFAVDSNVPWYLMDRSPPADASLLTYPQKSLEGAWKYATSTASGGFSVSEAHSAYIARMVGSELPIKSIPAGVDGFSHTRDPDLGS